VGGGGGGEVRSTTETAAENRVSTEVRF